jgi:hypothetical protein
VTSAQRLELIDGIEQQLDHLGDIELDLVAEYVGRVAMGQVTYGVFQEDDDRDFERAALEEVLDQAVYAARRLRQLRARREGA